MKTDRGVIYPISGDLSGNFKRFTGVLQRLLAGNFNSGGPEFNENF
jgi:hypothetical protein